MITETQQRFKDLSWFDPDYEITIGGAGGIGSWTAFLLGRIGYTLYIYDYDIIERHNLGGQLFSLDQVGQAKVNALAENIEKFSENSNVQAINDKLDENSLITDICFSCFDNMKARKTMFEKWKASETRKVFIDGRMSAELFQIYIVIPGREEEYEKSLFEDSEVEEQPCTMKATSHCASTIAGLMTAAFTNYVANEKEGVVFRAIPFYSALQLQILNLEFDL